MQVSRNPIETINLGKNGKKNRPSIFSHLKKKWILLQSCSFPCVSIYFLWLRHLPRGRVLNKVAEFERPTKIVVHLWSFGAIWRYNAIITLHYITYTNVRTWKRIKWLLSRYFHHLYPVDFHVYRDCNPQLHTTHVTKPVIKPVWFVQKSKIKSWLFPAWIEIDWISPPSSQLSSVQIASPWQFTTCFRQSLQTGLMEKDFPKWHTIAMKIWHSEHLRGKCLFFTKYGKMKWFAKTPIPACFMYGTKNLQRLQHVGLCLWS